MARTPLDGALPDNTNSPPCGLQLADHMAISFGIAIQLFSPEILSTAGPFEQMAIMPVPEATMNEQYGVVLRKDKIRLAWQGANIKTEPEALLVEAAPYKKFWGGVFVTNRGHHLASNIGSYNINHLLA